jgi:thiol-disulfide isomerase/thioredoxin
LLFFIEPGCGACDAALPELSRRQREYRDRLLIVPISRGEAGENRTKIRKFDLENVLLQSEREVADAFLADSMPSAVLLRDGQISSPLAVGADAIRGLVVRAVLPHPVKKGESVPYRRFPDLNGTMFDLANLKRRTLILLWNPSCGFCQQMLQDIKAWERSRPKGAPELLVISSGSLESNRAQGFRSRVLLDPDFAASQIFDSAGTPSAVLIDEEGK